jgi:hypothetical protein
MDPSGITARLIADLTRSDFPERGLEFGADGTITWATEPAGDAGTADAEPVGER